MTWHPQAERLKGHVSQAGIAGRAAHVIPDHHDSCAGIHLDSSIEASGSELMLQSPEADYALLRSNWCNIEILKQDQSALNHFMLGIAFFCC